MIYLARIQSKFLWQRLTIKVINWAAVHGAEDHSVRRRSTLLRLYSHIEMILFCMYICCGDYSFFHFLGNKCYFRRRWCSVDRWSACDRRGLIKMQQCWMFLIANFFQIFCAQIANKVCKLYTISIQRGSWKKYSWCCEQLTLLIIAGSYSIKWGSWLDS